MYANVRTKTLFKCTRLVKEPSPCLYHKRKKYIIVCVLVLKHIEAWF